LLSYLYQLKWTPAADRRVNSADPGKTHRQVFERIRAENGYLVFYPKLKKKPT